MPDPANRAAEIGEAIVRYCEDLVRIPTVNPPGDRYEDLCRYLVEVLGRLNCDAEMVRVPAELAGELYPWGKAYPRASVVGMYRGSRSQGPGLHLSGHFDVVPAGTGWARHPFEPVREGGKLFGLGASDMKGGIASILGAIHALADLEVELGGELTFSFTPDEETGGHAGVGYLARHGYVRGDFGIIAEPSQPHGFTIGHRGVLWVEVVAKGRTAHGSVPHKGVNAFEKIVAVASALKRLEEQLKQKQTAFPVIEPQQRSPTLMMGGVVRGGVKTNVVPDECMMTIDRRLIPEETVEEAYREIREVIDELKQRDPALEVALTTPLRIEPSHVPPDHILCSALAECHAEVHGKRPVGVLSPGFNDGHYLTRDLGIPTITYGPGWAGMAHSPDEYVLVDDLVRTSQVFTKAVLRLVG